MISERDSALVRQAWEGVVSGVQALTPAAKHVYELAVRQVYAEAASTLVLLVILIPSCLKMWRFVGTKENDYNNDGWYIAAGILTVATAVVAAVFVISCVPAIINPEWAAIERIAQMVKGDSK